MCTPYRFQAFWERCALGGPISDYPRFASKIDNSHLYAIFPTQFSKWFATGIERWNLRLNGRSSQDQLLDRRLATSRRALRTRTNGKGRRQPQFVTKETMISNHGVRVDTEVEVPVGLKH